MKTTEWIVENMLDKTCSWNGLRIAALYYCIKTYPSSSVDSNEYCTNMIEHAIHLLSTGLGSTDVLKYLRHWWLSDGVQAHPYSINYV